jgi:hypothetical protein
MYVCIHGIMSALYILETCLNESLYMTRPSKICIYNADSKRISRKQGPGSDDVDS